MTAAGILPGMDEPTAPRTDRRIVVALDGPASSGKSTVGAEAARRMGLRFLDTGLLYRALTWLALQHGLDPATPEAAPAIVALVPTLELAADADGRLGRVLVAGREVGDELRGAGIDARVSEVARIPAVRAALLATQRSLVDGGGIVMAGRDIGTVVLPDADLKLYLDASPEERARRRWEERGLRPEDPAARAVLEDLRRRDGIDTTRAVAPLRVAPDALVLVTDGLERHETIERVVAAIRAAELRRGGGGGA